MTTHEEAISFLENACRNWSRMPRLSEDDVADVASALEQFRLSSTAALEAQIASLKQRLESAEGLLAKLADAADSFHDAATAYFTDSTYDGDGILAASEANLSVSALPDARTFLQEQEKQNG